MGLKVKIQLAWIKVRVWLRLLPIFVVYLLSQPFVEVWKFFKLLLQKGAKLNYLRAWMPIFLALTIVSYLAKNRYVTNIFGLLLLITIIKWEWDKKDFVHIHRERTLKKMMRLKKKESSLQAGRGNQQEAAQPIIQKDEATEEQAGGETKNG